MVEESEIEKKLNGQITTLLNIDIENLIRADELGNQLSFSDIEETIKATLQLVGNLESQNFDQIPIGILEELYQKLAAIINHFGQIEKFDIKDHNNPKGQRDRIAEKTQQSCAAFYRSVAPVLTNSIINKQEIIDYEKQLKIAANKIKDEAGEYLKDIKDILDSSKDAAAKIGVAKYSETFNNEYKEHMAQYKWWLGYTIGMLALIIGAAILFIVSYKETNDQATIIQFAVSKLVILSVLFYGLSICSRNYRAHKHNAILNKHRQNALSTFEAFSNAAGDDIQTKNAVLVEATHTIFSNQDTGYLGTEGDKESTNKIIEIIKNVGERNS